MYVSTLTNSLTSRIERGISPRRAAKEQKTTQISKTRLRHGKKLLCYTVFLCLCFPLIINFNSSFSNLSMTETNFPLNKSRLYCALIFFDANLFKFRWQAIRDIGLSGRDLIVSHINHAWLDTTGFFTNVHTREVGVSGSPMCNLRAMCSIGERWFRLSSWIFKTKES